MKKRRTAKSPAARQKVRRGGLPHFRLIDDRTAVFAFLAFLVIILFLFDAVADQQSLFGSRTTKSTSPQSVTNLNPKLTKELADRAVSKLVIDTPQKDDVAFIVKDTVDPQLLDDFINMDYNTIKTHLGIQSDFVIHFEDEAGRIIPIGNRLCIGSKYASINGVPCS